MENVFFKFCLFHFFKFQMAIVENLMKKPSIFVMDFDGSHEVLHVTNIFYLHTFDNETTAVLRNAFCLFILSKWKKYYNLIFDCTVVHYANLNSSSINEPYLRAVEYTILLLLKFLIYVYFNEAFVKTFRKNSFSIQISKIHFIM